MIELSYLDIEKEFESWNINLEDKLPKDMYYVEIGKINRINYTSGKFWIDKIPLFEICFFENYNKAKDFFNMYKNHVVGSKYMFIYNHLVDNSKDYMDRCYGSLAYKDSRY